jgi:hypothetical protein
MSAVTIGFAGWGDWQLPAPVAVVLNDVGLQVSASGQGSVAGRASGRLTIGSGPDSGTIMLLLRLPYDTTAFELTYQPSGDTKPTLAALVSFVFAGWSLPGPVAAFARAIVISQFTVRIGRTSELLVSVSGAPGQAWDLVPGDRRLTVQQVFLDLNVTTGRQPTGRLGGTLVLGQGTLPLVVALQGSWTEFTLMLDRGRIAALPSVGDIASLISPGWGEALPPQLASLGSGMDLRTFTFARLRSGWSLTVAIGTRPDWTWQPVPGFANLTFTSAAVSFDKPATGQPAGRVQLSATVLAIAVDFRLAVPQRTITAKIDSDAASLGTLCRYVTGAGAPDWLSGIGLLAIDLALAWDTSTFSMATLLARDVPLPDGSTLARASVTAVADRSRRSVCIAADWVPPGGGNGIKGEICYPFTRFCPAGGGQCVDFPPKQTPPNPDPPNPPPYPDIVALVALVLAGGASILAAAIYAASLQAAAAQTAAAILAYEQAAANLLELARAIREAYEFNQRALQFLRDMQNALEHVQLPRPPLGEMAQIMHAAQFTPAEVAPPLKTAYQPAPGAMVGSLQNAWQQTIGAPEMTRALAVSPYPPVECAAPIQQAYHVPAAAEFATLFKNAGFAGPFTEPLLASILRAAPFSATQAIDGLRSAFAGITLATAVSSLASAAYPAPDVAAALRTSAYAPQVSTPAAMTSVLLAGYPGLSFGTLLEALSVSTFPAYAALPAALARYTPQPPAPAIALALLAAYPRLDPLSLATAAGNALLASGQLSAVLHAAFPALQPPAVQPLATAAATADFPRVVASCAQLLSQRIPLRQAASQLQDSTPGLPIYALTAALATIYAPGLADLATAVQAVTPNYSTVDGQLSLLLSSPATIQPATLATYYLQALEAADKTALPVGLGGGLAAAFSAVSRPLDASTLMQALLAAYTATGGSLSPADAASAARLAVGASALQAAQALSATFTTPPITAVQSANAITSAFGYPPGQPTDVAAALIAVFGIGRCPTATAALTLALQQASFSPVSVLSALPSLMTNWTVENVHTVKDVYADPIWKTAYLQWVQWGRSTAQVAQVLQRGYAPPPGRLVQVLAGACLLVIPATAATPLATGLKAVTLPYQQALQSLQEFFGPLWTPADTEQVRRVYQQP